MDAVFSGQAGTLAYLEGAEVRVRRMGDDGPELTIAREGASYLFQGCNDLVVALRLDAESIETKFMLAWEEDRALRLLLIALDVEEDTELRFDAGDCLEEMLNNGSPSTFIENQLYSRTLPEESDPLFVIDEPKWPRASGLVAKILERQPAIAMHREAWERVPVTLFDDGKGGFEELAIRAGAFRILASIDTNVRDPNLAILECHKALSRLPNARAIISEWTKRFKRAGTVPRQHP
jgi:hypothetical protein